MYFSTYHYAALFICAAAAILGVIYVCWKFYRATCAGVDVRSYHNAIRRAIGYVAMILAAWIVLSASAIMGIDSALKDYDLRAVRSYSAGDSVYVEAQIYNSGRIAVASCTLSVRIIDTSERRVKASNFASAFGGARGGGHKRSQEYLGDFAGVLAPGQSRSVKMIVPKIFSRYTLRSKLSCS